MIKYICISDTHMRMKDVLIPEGDILIHAGDLTFKGEEWEILPELDILAAKTKGYKKVICVQGNHEYRLRNQPELVRKFFEERGLVLLHHEPYEFEGIKYFGSPYTPTFGRWAFMEDRGAPIRRLWEQIPDDTQILITHGQPHLINDIIPPEYGGRDRSLNVGCEELALRIPQLKDLKLYVGGHLHSGYGITTALSVKYVNGSICNEKYEPVNKPIELYL
jgi:Icc-related predicted phosphoesterase